MVVRNNAVRCTRLPHSTVRAKMAGELQRRFLGSSRSTPSQQHAMSLSARLALQRTIHGLRGQCAQPNAILSSATRRSFSCSSVRRTDGVFRELTSMRVRTPWVEAFRRQQQEGQHPGKPSEKSTVPKNRDLTPKRMSDSYHSVVLPLARDPWLLDTYLNSSGHIRLGTIFMDLDALSGVIA